MVHLVWWQAWRATRCLGEASLGEGPECGGKGQLIRLVGVVGKEKWIKKTPTVVMLKYFYQVSGRIEKEAYFPVFISPCGKSQRCV